MSNNVIELLDEGLIQELIGECRVHIEEVELDLVNLAEGRMEATAEAVNRVFRAFHSVKGALAYLGFDSLKRLTHVMESLLIPVRNGTRAPSSCLWEAMLPGLDCLKAMTADAASNERIPTGRQLARLTAILDDTGVAPARPKKPCAQRYRARRPQGIRALVAEDDFACRVMLQRLLSRYGECHIAVNGREAVEAFHEARRVGANYDLICMDIRMPEMDGRTAVETIRAEELADGIVSTDGVRIFMTTGVLEMKSVTGCFKLLCDAYLFKPVEGDLLDQHLISYGLIG
jgi:two-component system, chemotaxis family, chemotaxis protein CheY